MANNKDLTIFQRLQNVFSAGSVQNVGAPRTNIYSFPTMADRGEIIDRASSQSEKDMKILQHRQQKYLSMQWVKAQDDINNKSIVGLNDVRLMYRDVDLMDEMPEIGAALDIVSEESCSIGSSGQLLKVSSKSDRIKAILEDLFYNRLTINTVLPMITRGTTKYGNNFQLLNIDKTLGVIGWKELPVHEMERYENTKGFPYQVVKASDSIKPDETIFVWLGASSQATAYRNWQIAHFRLLYDSRLLPYGVSFLNKARRHYRMLSMMEDCMLIYRLDRSVERRIFKINVGAMDEGDIEAHVQNIANNFKRTPIIDPMTGQVDLRKNIMCQTNDFFIPVRDPAEPSPIETLSAGQNLTAMDDIKYVQKKIVTALRVPKSFLNFEETAGEGKNLSLLDVRFMRTVNRIQQCLLMELNKIATIHLMLLGFTDDLTNFTLSMENPSMQAEMLELDNLAKKVTTAKDAVSDPGGGIPLASYNWVWRNIFKWSEKEIAQNLSEIRLETALATELKKTPQIISRTGIFDNVDNIYGEPDAQYSASAEEGEDGGDGGAMGGMGGGGGIPMGDMDFGDDSGMGEEGEMDMEDAATEDAAMNGSEPPADNGSGDEGGAAPAPEGLAETITSTLKTRVDEAKERAIQHNQKVKKRFQESVMERYLKKVAPTINETVIKSVPLYDKAFFINEELNSIVDGIKAKKENIVLED